MMSEEPIVGLYYLCFREGKFISEAQFVYDKNIGEAFISLRVNENGDCVNYVIDPDEWILKE